MRSEQRNSSASTRARDAPPPLDVSKLCKRFGAITAVDDISFVVPGGAFLSLVGPSGSGKTTVLRLISGFDLPDRGTISIGGTDVTPIPPYRRDIGVVFQRYALFPHMSVADNVGFPLKQRRVPARTRRSRVEAILADVGLSDCADRRPGQLSGGQQQRVALARALVFEPRILVMDEPLAALDKGLREQMQQEVKKLQRRLRITTVYVTHDQAEAFAMSDLVAVMNGGRIDQLDTPRNLYESPRTEFVARFLGDSNIFVGEEISSSGGVTTIRLTDGTALQCPPVGGSSAPIKVLVRPGKINVQGPDVRPPSENLLRGRITDVTFLGDSLRWRVSAAGQEVIVHMANPDIATAWQPGDAVTLSWNASDSTVL